MEQRSQTFLELCTYYIWRFLRWGGRFPFYIRLILGILFIGGGLVGFLPILGFWMLPLGLLLIGTTIPLVSTKIKRWVDMKQSEYDQQVFD